MLLNKNDVKDSLNTYLHREVILYGPFAHNDKGITIIDYVRSDS